MIKEIIVINSEKAIAPHSSTLAWKIPWMAEPGRLQSVGSRTVGYDWATPLSLFSFIHWRRKWQPTPVFLPGESRGRGSLVGCRLWGRRIGHDWSDLAAAAAMINYKFLLTKTLLNLYFYDTFLMERYIYSILLSTIHFTSLLLLYHYSININFLAAFGSKTILEIVYMAWSMKKETHSKIICKYTQLLACFLFCLQRRKFYIKLVRQDWQGS